MAAEPRTGIKNADEIITLALAHDLTVTVTTQDRDTLTSHTVRIGMRVPAAYAGTELGRALQNQTVTMLWTMPKRKGARGRLEDATEFSAVTSRKVRTLAAITSAVRGMGRDAAQHARDTAPLPEDVVDAPHAVYVDGRQVAGIPAAHVRIVNGGTPEVIPTDKALREINNAMMAPGNKGVREMSAAGSRARIAYRDNRGTVELRPATPEEAAAGIVPESERHAPGDPVIVRPVVYDPATRTHHVLPEYEGTVGTWASPHYYVRANVADEYGYGVRPCRPSELRPATDTAEQERARARQTRAHAVRLEAQQLGTNQVIEEEARAVLESGGVHREVVPGSSGYRFRTNHLAVRLYALDAQGENWEERVTYYALRLERHNWHVTNKTDQHGPHLILLPPDDVTAVVSEGRRRARENAHAEALTENAGR
ncbi:hypothetical protein ABZV65_30475 [Streptomyces bauhiniae]|uniref:hypothetical protein n=1 Tax=Streptomyces bauhiniae TaxID=2340725 RepID=UPI0033B47409